MSWWDRLCWCRGRPRVLLGGLVWDKVLVLLLLALFVLGPERLPVVAEPGSTGVVGVLGMS